MVVAPAQSPAAGAPKVLLLSGKPAAAAAAGAPAGRALPLMLPGQRGASPEAESGGPPQARKRQRLTHLSPEEKALRRWARAGIRDRIRTRTKVWVRIRQCSGAFGLAGPVPAWRGRDGAGQGRAGSLD